MVFPLRQALTLVHWADRVFPSQRLPWQLHRVVLDFLDALDAFPGGESPGWGPPSTFPRSPIPNQAQLQASATGLGRKSGEA